MAGGSHPKSLKDFGGDRAKGNSDRQNRNEWIKPKMLMKNNPQISS